MSGGPEMWSKDLLVDGVPVSISSCVFGALFSPAPLLFCHLVEKERLVRMPVESSGHGISDLLMCPLEGGGREK